MEKEQDEPKSAQKIMGTCKKKKKKIQETAKKVSAAKFGTNGAAERIMSYEPQHKESESIVMLRTK